MPHVILKLSPGKSEQQKAMSVSMEEVAASDWLEEIYKPDIEARPDQLCKKPGYRPEDL